MAALGQSRLKLLQEGLSLDLAIAILNKHYQDILSLQNAEDVCAMGTASHKFPSFFLFSLSSFFSNYKSYIF